LVRLVDDLLEVSRISTGKLTLQRSRIPLQTVVDHAVEASLPMIGASEHQVELQVAEQPVWIDGDLTRLAQVLTNLLINAAKYTPRGGRIVLFAGVDGNDAVMRVSDSGHGIAPSMQQQIFDLFAQVDGQREDAQAGLGIGLALVRQLLQMHGGDVECESLGVGHGSTFTARLPMIAPALERGH
jgi:signal transduction histidine kinase